MIKKLLVLFVIISMSFNLVAKQAKKSTKKSKNKYWESHEQRFQNAKMKMNNGNYSRARDMFIEIVRNTYQGNQFHEQSMYYIGFCSVKMRNFNAAINEYRQFINKYSNSDLTDDAYYVLGRTYEQTGNNYQAIQMYKELLNRFPYSNFKQKARERLNYLGDNGYDNDGGYDTDNQYQNMFKEAKKNFKIALGLPKYEALQNLKVVIRYCRRIINNSHSYRLVNQSRELKRKAEQRIRMIKEDMGNNGDWFDYDYDYDYGYDNGNGNGNNNGGYGHDFDYGTISDILRHARRANTYDAADRILLKGANRVAKTIDDFIKLAKAAHYNATIDTICKVSINFLNSAYDLKRMSKYAATYDTEDYMILNGYHLAKTRYEFDSLVGKINSNQNTDKYCLRIAREGFAQNIDDIIHISKKTSSYNYQDRVLIEGKKFARSYYDLKRLARYTNSTQAEEQILRGSGYGNTGGSLDHLDGYRIVSEKKGIPSKAKSLKAKIKKLTKTILKKTAKKFKKSVKRANPKNNKK